MFFGLVHGRIDCVLLVGSFDLSVIQATLLVLGF